MNNFRNPRWLIVISIIPIAILFWIFFGTFRLIESQLVAENIQQWKLLGGSLGILWMIHLVFTFTMILKKKLLNVTYSIVTLAVYIPFLYLYSMKFESIIPSNIPGWMISENIILYAGTFIMPTLAHSLLLAVVCLTPEARRSKAWLSFTIAVLIPVAWYLIFQLIMPLWKIVPNEYEYHTIIILVITFVIGFLFFLLRGVYLLSTNNKGFLFRYRIVWRVILALLFPVAGLVVSENFFDNIFGNFTDPWFYVIAVINGVAVILPERDNRTYRLILFVVRSITFSYLLYFFLVFLPYLPLSILAVIAFGLGFLMLTPLILFVLQVNMLAKDFSYLFLHYNKRQVYGLFAISMIVLPMFVTLGYLHDRVLLHKALSYVYEPSPDRATEPHISGHKLGRILDHIEQHRRTTRWDGNTQLPFLSNYYNWLVLDNLTLSNTKVGRLREIFQGQPLTSTPTFIQTGWGKNPAVNISAAHASSVFDHEQNAWISSVDLEITNQSPDSRLEFATEFKLPKGAWIDNYYLWIGSEKVEGILSERKAATWIYQMITSENRDPGMLTYINPTTVSLHVFPFMGSETRRTGFRILHKEPLAVTLDDHVLQLGNTEHPLKRPVLSYDSNTVYIPATVKRNLPLVKRKPHYHFIVDGSKSPNNDLSDYRHRIQNFVKREELNPSDYSIAVVNSTSHDVKNSKAIPKVRREGGFFAERAIGNTLMQYTNNAHNYPVIIIVTNNFDNAILPDDFTHLEHAYPESDLFFELTPAGMLQAHSLAIHPRDKVAPEQSLQYDVVAWPGIDEPTAILRLNDQPEIVLKKKKPEIETSVFTPHDWTAALTLHGLWLSSELHRDSIQKNRELIRHNFETGVMMPATSYIALENEAQRKALLKKQEEILNGHPALDASADVREMSEPGFTAVVVILFLFFVIRGLQKKNAARCEQHSSFHHLIILVVAKKRITIIRWWHECFFY